MHKLYIHIKFFSEEVTGPTFKPFNIKELKNPNPDWHDFCFVQSENSRGRSKKEGGHEKVRGSGFTKRDFNNFNFSMHDLA